MARRALTVLVLGVLVAPMLAVLGATAPPAGASGGLSESDTTTYVVDPAAGAVHVTVDISARNNKSGYLIYGLSLGVLAEATNFRGVRDGGGTLTVTAKPADVPVAKFLEVRFADLGYGSTLNAHVMYDLPNGAPRSTSLTRVTSAFSTFIAWAQGDPGQSNVRIVVPKAFAVDLSGNDMNHEDSGDTVTYTADTIADPNTWSVAVSARDDSALVSKNLAVAGIPVRVRGFPDDPQWSTFAAGRVKIGVPHLQKLIGLPWPTLDPLVVTETVTPYIYGYAGWYKQEDNTIEIGDALDAKVIFHEISHVWFNDVLYNERWIDEGLAQEYAARVVQATGGKASKPNVPNADPHNPGFVALTDWGAADIQDKTSTARENYGYNASWHVIHLVTKEIGIDAMRRVIVAASKSAMPYRGTTNLVSQEAHSWHGFLDNLDEIGHSKKADALFTKYVAEKGDEDLVARKESRAEYAKLVAAGNGWQPPFVVREAMSNWDFTGADALMPKAETVLATHNEIEKTLAPLHLHAPAKLLTDYDADGADLDVVEKEATTDLAAAKALVAASSAVAAHHGLFAKIGLIGAKHKTDLADAKRAFAHGDGAHAGRDAAAAQKLVADAGGAGQVRVGGAFGLLVLLVLLVWVLRKWRSRRRARKAARAQAAAAEAAAATVAEPWSASSAPWTPVSGPWGESPEPASGPPPAPDPALEPAPAPPGAPAGDPAIDDPEPGPAG